MYRDVYETYPLEDMTLWEI